MQGMRGGGWLLPMLAASFLTSLMVAVALEPVAAPGHGERATDPREAFIEMRLVEVLLPDGTGDGAALLVDADGRWTLPLFLSRTQTERLEQGGAGPEDSPARLLETALGQLGQLCTAVELDEYDGGPGGSIVLGDGRRLDVLGGQLEAALGLAVRTKTPVRASRRLLETRGIAKDAGKAAGPSLPTGVRPSRSL